MRHLIGLWLCCVMTLSAAEDYRAALLAHCIAQAGPNSKGVVLELFGQAETEFVLIQADEKMGQFESARQSLSVPWRLLANEQLFTLALPTITTGTLAAQVAFIEFMGANRRQHFLYSQMTPAVEQWMAEQGTKASTAKDEAKDPAVKETRAAANVPEADAPIDAEKLAALDSDEEGDLEAPESIKDWDQAIFGKRNEIRGSAYVQAVGRNDGKSVDRRLGPGGEAFKTDDRDDPLVYLPEGATPYLWKKRTVKPVDWTGYGGQVGYVPKVESDPGLGRIRFAWTNHEDHGGSKFWHEYLLTPTYDEWWAKKIDPGLAHADWLRMSEQSGTLPRPLAIARGNVSWSNCGIQVFANGLIGASGYGNNGDKYPCTRLPPGSIPSAVAVTPNNEFALVTTWNVKKQIGELYVVALESRSMEHHNPPYAGMTNVACYTRLKILGSVELPFSCPSGIATTSDVATWKWSSDLSKERLTSASVREAWIKRSDALHHYPNNGFAVVISRAESKACLVDLSPLYQAFARAYFTEYDDKIVSNEGPAPEQWPQTFAVMERATPKVGKAFGVPQPTVVACGYADPSSMANKIFIGCMKGTLFVMEPGNGQLKTLASVNVGRNPTAIALGRDVGHRDKEIIIVVSRGDRQVSLVAQAGTSAARIDKVLRDKRLIDPVAIQAWESRGSSGFTIADFKGQKLVNYLHRPIIPWGDASMFPNFGGPEKMAFECTGILPIEGYPYILTAAEVN